MTHKVTGFGGGHGLYATLRAFNYLKSRSPSEIEITAVVGVSDDGGSSGRLREAFPIVPPGDLRMALAALCPIEILDTDPQALSQVENLLQYRFGPDSPAGLSGHAVGNILLAALWSQGLSPVEGLEALGEILNSQGRVLPASVTPTVITAKVRGLSDTEPDQICEISGQVSVATTRGEVISVALKPSSPEVCPEVVSAILESDYLVFGPGSWFTSVVPHLLVPGIRQAVSQSPGERVLVVNLAAQTGETSKFDTIDYLRSWRELAPEIALDTVIADPVCVIDFDERKLFEQTASELGARVHWQSVSRNSHYHDPLLLAEVFDKVCSMKRGTTWQ